MASLVGSAVGAGLATVVCAGFESVAVGRPPWATWWVAGFAFIGIELVAHLGLQLRGRPSFFNGRG